MALPKTAKIITGLVLVSVLGGGIYLLTHHQSDANQQSTDDAYVRADFTLVAPRVNGQIARVLVSDDETVKAGQLLAEIDDRDLRVAVQSAQAETASAQAATESLKATIKRQAATIQQAQAAVRSDEASIALAKANAERYRNLSADGSGTRQEAQNADAQLLVHKAALDRDKAGVEAARLQISILGADLKKAESSLDRAKAAQAVAELNLSYTKIIAPINGTVARRSVRQGAFVNVGSPLLAVVPLEKVYVEANFRETQLANIHPGQAAQIKVDSLPGVIVKGHVESVSPASGAAFAPVAPQNATGNFTKIVQRIPVRISIDPAQPYSNKLRVGMSAQPTISTKSEPGRTTKAENVKGYLSSH
ncbi:HlyD family secretion protein [Oryzomonas rubra]|uniref:HlyD family secretion protein n=1 Tax=Oryzomonas rubra TaxID=2509454 RepID=A0A5A9X547_9BACT|nr:HlyD family secretion protein [Oryzomonas rubra]KAA0888120.1 HlyD family secretion protein [Oryzomonas rubra]